jgi:medium-chain acyl-[acyl-carrier-protein] hydrolase
MRIFRPSRAVAGPGVEIRRRLFCFPYAGAGAAIFRTWADLLPPDIELCVPVLPGRDARVAEAAIPEMGPLVDSLIGQMAPRLTLPYAMFGHSMGAFVAFDLAHEIVRRGVAGPFHLFVSAQRGPRLPYPETPIFHLPDDRFLAGVIARYKNIPKPVMEQQDFMRVLLRILRADFTIVEAYTYRAQSRLACPITVFGGSDDDRITAGQLEAWSMETSDRCTIHLVSGGHFFMDSARAQLLALIRQELGSWLTTSSDRRGSTGPSIDPGGC